MSIPAPTMLFATARSGNQIDLTWHDNSSTEDGFQVYRSRDKINWAKIANTKPNITSFSNNSGLAPLTKYYYKVRAFLNTTFSLYSNTDDATTLTGPPPPPTSISSNYHGDVNIWTDPDVILYDNFESYTTGFTGVALQDQLLAGTNPTHLKPQGKWNNVAHSGQYLQIEAGTGFSGSKCLAITIPKNVTGDPAASISNRTLETLGLTTIYMRWYHKWRSDYYCTANSNHNGCGFRGGDIPGLPGSIDGGPGQIPPADGSGWWTLWPDNNSGGHYDTFAKVQEQTTPPPADSPYFFHIYAYYAGHSANKWWPDGTNYPPGEPGNVPFTDKTVYPDFVAQACTPFLRDTWYCCEQMVKINDPSNGTGPHNGEVQFWVNGVSKAHFTNLYFAGFRKSNGKPAYPREALLQIDRNDLQATDLKKWYDNVVIAKRYIGPMT